MGNIKLEIAGVTGVNIRRTNDTNSKWQWNRND